MRALSICVLLLYPVIGYPQGQASILDRKVSVSFTNEKIATVLNRIGQQAGFSFSYNSSIISEDQVVTLSLRDKTVQEVLNEVFKGSMNYKEKGNHLILSRVEVKQSRAPSVTSMIISGYVENALTKEKIVDASVYEKETISSVLTDDFGFFRIKLDKKAEEALSITISKKEFRDTTLVMEETGNQYFHISLRPLAPPPAPIEEPVPLEKIDSAAFSSPMSVDTASGIVIEPVVETLSDPPVEEEAEPEVEELILPYESLPNVQNISDTLYRDIQLSILPFIGTNGRMSGNIVNGYSINIFGGFSMGTEQIEVGGFFNINRGHVGFLQLAGFGNMVGGNVNGVQAAGLFNIAGGVTKGVQVGGLTNVNVGDVDGVQVAGLANINLAASNGVQVAGIYNQSNGESDGLKVAGIANVHGGDFDGPQIAGIMNINNGTIRGSQFSGIYNYGRKVYGTQVGFINYADSLTGVPIGFLSFVKHGYHKLEFSADEMFYANVAYRTGVRRFYNIVLAGMRPEFPLAPEGAWTFGYGVGTAPKLARWLFLNVDATGQSVHDGGWSQSLSMLARLQVGFDIQLGRKFSIYAGGTMNWYFSDAVFEPFLTPQFPPLLPSSQSPALYGFSPPIFYDEDINNEVNLKMWVGGKIALRFL
jgi:hypothetical protein